MQCFCIVVHYRLAEKYLKVSSHMGDQKSEQDQSCDRHDGFFTDCRVVKTRYSYGAHRLPPSRENQTSYCNQNPAIKKRPIIMSRIPEGSPNDASNEDRLYDRARVRFRKDDRKADHGGDERGAPQFFTWHPRLPAHAGGTHQTRPKEAEETCR